MKQNMDIKVFTWSYLYLRLKLILETNFGGSKWKHESKKSLFSNNTENLIMESNDMIMINGTKKKWSSCFDMKDLGELHYLGIWVTRADSQIGKLFWDKRSTCII